MIGFARKVAKEPSKVPAVARHHDPSTLLGVRKSLGIGSGNGQLFDQPMSRMPLAFGDVRRFERDVMIEEENHSADSAI